ncbi:hypothetical protein BROUX41_003411 [Berkeleyomyces rouxiae]|uniref:uncharacterized protein n=1 Tax=Berkeleyomyces rouxiae TaxID=2035830 RepID=UPI003B7CDE93
MSTQTRDDASAVVLVSGKAPELGNATTRKNPAASASKSAAGASTTAVSAPVSVASTNVAAPNAAVTKPQFPPPKTDKPRPHVCQTCQRSFARLEHLKRHERSHTKEKPFECPQCRRCFARRDLLLRHQQKLHQTSTPNPRPRNRRDSTAAAAPASGRVRKNSVAGTITTTTSAAAAAAAAIAATAASGASVAAPRVQPAPRPRANTISHIDNGLQMQQQVQNMLHQQMQPPRMPSSHVRHPSLIGLANLHHSGHGLDLSFGNITTSLGAHRNIGPGLSRIDTNALHDPFDSTSFRTAPPTAFDFDMGDLFFSSNTTTHTINPNALHYNDSPQSMPMDPTLSPPLLNNETAEWLENMEPSQEWNNDGSLFTAASSPSVISNGSHGLNESLPMIPNNDQFLLDNPLPGHTGINMIQSSFNEMALMDTGDQAFSAATAATMWPPTLMNGHMGSLGLDTNFSEFLVGNPMSPVFQPVNFSSITTNTTAPSNIASPSAPAPVPSSLPSTAEAVYNTGSESPSSAATTLHSAVSASSPASSVTDTTRDTVGSGMAQPQNQQNLDHTMNVEV